MKRVSIWFLLCLMLTSGAYYMTQTTQLACSKTPSLPYRCFLIFKGKKAKSGDLVSFKGHQTAYLPNVLFTKRIIGVAGDEINYERGKLYVGKHYVGAWRTRGQRGETLTPIVSGIIPPGYVFVKGDHGQSFDSRYSEFGLVAEKHLIGKTYGLF